MSVVEGATCRKRCLNDEQWPGQTNVCVAGHPVRCPDIGTAWTGTTQRVSMPGTEEPVSAVARLVDTPDCAVHCVVVGDKRTGAMLRARTWPAGPNDDDVLASVISEQWTAGLENSAPQGFYLDLTTGHRV